MKYKRGDQRNDGKVFWGYTHQRKDGTKGEYWVTPEQFEDKKAKQNASSLKHYKANPPKRNNEQRREYSKNNRAKLNIYAAKWRAKNRDKERSRCKAYREKNKNNPLHKLKRNYRSRVWEFAKSFKEVKSKRTQELLGCDWNAFTNHIEQQFQRGMSWDNYGEWHIDHIIPLSSAKTEEQLISLFHYKNTQPLSAEDNLAKTNKLNT